MMDICFFMQPAGRAAARAEFQTIDDCFFLQTHPQLCLLRAINSLFFHMIYTAVYFSDTTEVLREVLIALLTDIGYEGFEEEGDILKAFIPEIQFDSERLHILGRELRVSYSVTSLPETNWNQVWESNFQPVTVGVFCRIRADFHEPLQGITHEIVITPKMSFGTGHHATTHMMIRQMEEVVFAGRNVLDFGTGTGVLAILAEKLGAARVIAIDNDEWSIQNAEENFQRNGVASVTLRQADHARTGTTVDIILANIVRQVIVDNFPFFIEGLAQGGFLLLSGLLAEDEAAILAEATKAGLHMEKKLEQDGWLCLRFRR